MKAKKIIITEQGLLDLGFTLEDNDCYTINILDVRLPKFKRIDLWTRTEWGLKMFLDISEGEQPDQTSMELPHIKHIDELQNLFFALTGTMLDYKPKVST
ncbi:hypothetical protein [Polaribacter sp.]|uniref:hypothetical protein n=1 Tax=Polaribacter sp. TaxID=1920175 RepID=UPI003F6B314D